MTTSPATADSANATKPRGRPFLPGNTANPNGRPKKGHAIRDLLKSVPVAKKRELVAVAYQEALDGDVHWAEWIAKHSGEGHTGSDGDVNIDARQQTVIVVKDGRDLLGSGDDD